MKLVYKKGELVIFRVSKWSQDPGPRAVHIHPAPRGDLYNYDVDKFWAVTEVLTDGQLLVVTRRGKTHVVNPADPRLRKASFWERMVYRSRFPAPSAQQGGSQPPDNPIRVEARTA